MDAYCETNHGETSLSLLIYFFLILVFVKRWALPLGPVHLFFLLGIPTVHSRALEGLCAGEAYANVVMAVAGASIAGPGSEHVREEWLANPLPMHAGL